MKGESSSIINRKKNKDNEIVYKKPEALNSSFEIQDAAPTNE